MLKAVTVARNLTGTLLEASAKERARSWAALVTAGRESPVAGSWAQQANGREQMVKKKLNIQHPMELPAGVHRFFHVEDWALDIFNGGAQPAYA
jgi:hypothetical protein